MYNGSLGFAGIDFRDGNIQTLGNIFDGFVAFGNDTDRFGNSLGSDGMITSDHYNFNTGRTALGYGIGYSGTGRINHGHETNETQVIDGEVDVVSVEFEASGVFVGGQHEVTETQDTFTQTSQFHVGVVESFLHLFVQDLFFAVDENGGATFQDTFGGTLHDEQVTWIGGIFSFVN